jgi:FHA domain-containing protein
MTATFGPQGGTIGRNPGVTLVLPDEGRTISRQQATIAFAAGQFVFAEQGSNPSTLNGEPMGPGRSAPLKHGDTLIMGPYTLQVEVVGAQMPMDERTRMAPPRAAKAAAPRPAPVPAAAPFVPPAPAPAAFIPPAPASMPAFVPPPPASMPAFVPPPPASMPAFMPPPPAPPAFIAPPQSPAPDAAAPVHAPIAAGIPAAGDSFDPFASLIAPKPLGSAPVAASPAAFMPAPGAAPAPAGGFDIFAGLGGAAPAPAAGAFADPLAGFGSPGAASMPPPAGAGLPAGGIPDDFDIFGAPPASKPAPTPSSMGSLGADLNIGTPGDSASSIDSLFGLGGSSGKVDPLAVLGAPAPVQGATGVAGSVDPLAMFGGQAAPQGAGPATSNHTPEVNSLFALPKAAGAPPAVDAASRQAMDDVLAAARAPAPNMLATGSFKLNPSAQAPALQPAMPAVAPARPAMVSGGPAGGQAAGQDALLLALLRGLDCPVDVSQGLTEDLMFRIGQLLRETTQGTIELLAARALSKREVKAQATVIMERANNPLKFSPDVASAMPFLLAEKPNRAFMPPVEAMRDSYNDLRSHQVGVMAGMRAALEGVLGRFTPEQLEKRLTQKSMLDSLIPAARKAKLWDLYVEMYRDIAEEAGDDFHKLFGRAFTEAYEEQVDLLRKQDPRT